MVDELSQNTVLNRRANIFFYVCTYTNIGIYLNRCMPILRFGQSIGARGWAVPLDKMSLGRIGLGSNICGTCDPMMICPLPGPRVSFLSWIIPNDKGGLGCNNKGRKRTLASRREQLLLAIKAKIKGNFDYEI